MTQEVALSLHRPVLRWYAENARDLPWRKPGVSAWAVLVSEIMLQQTPVSRVEPIWREWLARWPTPSALADDAPGEAVRAWGRLGYPRRAMRLHACALAIVERYEGTVPADADELLALPGVGTYTAAAVSAFAFGSRATVVDTNVRRVLTRAITGVALPTPTLNRADTHLAAESLPTDDDDAARWNAAVMELGALVCTAKQPACDGCPIATQCTWVAAGSPAYSGPARRSQAWHGTDRQCRGALLQAVREHEAWIGADTLQAAWPQDHEQRQRCLAALLREGLLHSSGDPRARVTQPGHPDSAHTQIARSQDCPELAIWYGFATQP